MNKAGELLNQSFGVISRNSLFVLLYLGYAAISASLADKTDTDLLSLPLTLLAYYIQCGMLGGFKEGINSGYRPGFQDSYGYARKYFLRIIVISMVIGMVTSLPAVVYGILNMSADFQVSNLSTNFLLLLSCISAATTTWSVCANSNAVYNDRGIVKSIGEGIRVAADYWYILAALLIIGPANVAIFRSVPETSIIAQKAAQVIGTLIWCSGLTVFYAILTIKFSRQKTVSAA